MSRYAILNRITGDLITYNGQVLVHNSRAEMEFLYPKSRIIQISDGDLGRPVMSIKDHPSMVSVRWPLRKEDFVHAG